MARGLSNSRSYLKSALPCEANEIKFIGCSRVLFIFGSVMDFTKFAKEVRNTENKIWWCDQLHLIHKVTVHLRETVNVKFCE